MKDSNSNSREQRAERSKVNKRRDRWQRSLTYGLVQVVTHWCWWLRLVRIVNWCWMADALLTVRRCAIGWFIGEDARLVGQLVVVGWLSGYIVERGAGRVIMSVIWC